jgi:hypothetical protein
MLSGLRVAWNLIIALNSAIRIIRYVSLLFIHYACQKSSLVGSDLNDVKLSASVLH